jgi:hypothetical protein
MLVYLTGKNKEMAHHRTFHNAYGFARDVDDSECSKIICEDFLSTHYVDEIKQVLELILKKARIGCHVIISEKDIATVARQVYRNSTDILNLNKIIFNDKTSVKSMLSMEVVESLIPENFKVKSKEYGSICFTITLERFQ